MLVRQQGLGWDEARLMIDGFDKDSMLWRHKGLRGSKPSNDPDSTDGLGNNLGKNLGKNS